MFKKILFAIFLVAFGVQFCGAMVFNLNDKEIFAFQEAVNALAKKSDIDGLEKERGAMIENFKKNLFVQQETYSSFDKALEVELFEERIDLIIRDALKDSLEFLYNFRQHRCEISEKINREQRPQFYRGLKTDDLSTEWRFVVPDEDSLRGFPFS